MKDGFVIILVSQGRKPKPREVNYPVWGNRVSMWQKPQRTQAVWLSLILHAACLRDAPGCPQEL